MENKKVILIIGIPGSGKSTFANMLKDNNTDIISASSLISTLSKDERDKYINEYVALGLTIPDNIYCNWVIEYIKNSNKSNFIIEGFPYNYNQAIIAKNNFKRNNIEIKKVYYIKISVTNALERIKNRKICEICNKSFSADIHYCPICHNRIKVRKDDKIKIAKKRINKSIHDIENIIKYYSSQRLLVEINALDLKDNI